MTKTCETCGKEFYLPIKSQTLFSLVKNCPECTEQRESELRKMAPLREVAHEERAESFLQKHCPPIYRETDPARIDQNRLTEVFSWRFGQRGLLIKGESGRGKTRAAWLLIKRLLEEGRNVEVFDCIDFDLECQDRFLQGNARDWVRRLSQIEVVFFDDLGKGKFTDRVESTLFGLMEKRMANKLPVIVTTNDTSETMKQKMSGNRGEPFIRRLQEFCEVVTF